MLPARNPNFPGRGRNWYILLSFAFSHFVPKPLFFQLNGAGILYRAIVLAVIASDVLRPARESQPIRTASQELAV